MDSFRGFDEDRYAPVEETGRAVRAPDDVEAAIERPPEIGVDERRMHVRAYNYWVSLLDGRPYPSIQDLRPQRLEDFSPHSVLLDFTRDPEDPEIAYLGTALREECEIGPAFAKISEVPSRSLLSRLTDHYLQIVANRAPIGFEAEFLSHRGVNTLYRGILMPLSSDGEEIDFIYGVINWKELVDSGTAGVLGHEVDQAMAAAPPPADLPVWADGPNAELPEAEERAPPASDEGTLSLWGEEDEDADADADGTRSLPEDAGLADHLGLARESAEIARGADHRSRAALYRALGHAYDFALIAESRPEEYAELLDDSGIKAQARAPMTPIVKLVFGADYDKTRLTEFAAALSWGRREELGFGQLAARLEAHGGGLKGVVQAERAARRPAPRPDQGAARKERLRAAAPIASLEGDRIAADAIPGDIVLLIGRQEADGSIAILAPAVTDEKLVDRAIAKASS